MSPDDPAAGRLVTWVDFVAADPVSAAGTAVGLLRAGDLTAVAVHDSADALSGPDGGPDRPEGVTDRVVWEIMTGDQYDVWLGESPGPDRDVLERHPGGLLVLAKLTRAPGSHIPHRDAVVHALAGGPLTTEAIHRAPGPLLAAAAALRHREP